MVNKTPRIEQVRKEWDSTIPWGVRSFLAYSFLISLVSMPSRRKSPATPTFIPPPFYLHTCLGNTRKSEHLFLMSWFNDHKLCYNPVQRPKGFEARVRREFLHRAYHFLESSALSPHPMKRVTHACLHGKEETAGCGRWAKRKHPSLILQQNTPPLSSNKRKENVRVFSVRYVLIQSRPARNEKPRSSELQPRSRCIRTRTCTLNPL